MNEDEYEDDYDTVLFATGRSPFTKDLNASAAGLFIEKNDKIRVDENERTNVPNIYAIGDVTYGRWELTPLATKAGKLLAKRLFDGSKEKMDYNNVPTTVFSPLEYGTVGISEEDAKQKYGEKNIASYHSNFRPVEWQFNKERPDGENCYVKILVNKADKNRVVGYHLLAPNAGEVTQGLAVAMK